jgi:uncharacterized membrane protein YqjE
MSTSTDRAHEQEIASLLKDTVDGLGALIGDHLALARVELRAEAAALGRRAALLVSAASCLLLGYGLACVAAALAIGRRAGAPLGFLIVACVHVFVGMVALVVVRRRSTGARPLRATSLELGRTAAALSAGRTP